MGSEAAMIRLAPGHGVGALGGMSGRAWVLVALC